MDNDAAQLTEPHRLRCIFLVQDKDGKAERVRLTSWSVTDLQELYSLLEKDYSREVAKRAIPLLVSDINGLKKSEEVRRKFLLMARRPDAVRSVLDVSSVAGDDDGELFRQGIEQLLNEPSEENHESGS